MATRTDVPAALTRPSRHLFLSPHYDDIALSAGATVRRLANHGLEPETIVVFGSEPDRSLPLTAFARSLHDAWGLTAEEVIASRQAEEHAAASVLGAHTRVLPFRDAIYRGERYLSDDDLFGVPAATEVSLPAEIIASLELGGSADADTRIYAPLGVGRHVDHQTVFRAATDLAARGWDVWFYEDIPYALKPGALEARLPEATSNLPLVPVARIPALAAWDEKVDAILNYPSQLETVFTNYVGVGTSREEINEALAGYARRVGDGTLAERFWHVSDASI
ncbi:MAG: PIG-L deacetylase family protein [Thermomicrobiales bacterium]